jgi:hypothetical protein
MSEGLDEGVMDDSESGLELDGDSDAVSAVDSAELETSDVALSDEATSLDDSASTGIAETFDSALCGDFESLNVSFANCK